MPPRLFPEQGEGRILGSAPPRWRGFRRGRCPTRGAEPSRSTSGWGGGLGHFDNDGQKDLFVAQGHVLDNVEKIDPSLHYLEPTLLALNRNGRLESADPGTAALVAARGAAFGDLNNDGSIDVVTTVLGGHPQVFMNRGGTGHWLTITLRGTRSNRDGLGARVLVNGQTRIATTARSEERRVGKEG